MYRERCKASLCVCQPRFLFFYSLVTHCNQLKRLPETDGPRLKLISIVDFGSLLKHFVSNARSALKDLAITMMRPGRGDAGCHENNTKTYMCSSAGTSGGC